MKRFVMIALPLFLTACYTPKYSPAGVLAAPQAVGKSQEKRINTIECKDADDWYLDGYRVGKSFANDKEAMWQHRASYCGFSARNVPKAFQQNWQNGFRIGLNPAARRSKR